MSGLVLTTSSTITCPHGGQATLLTSNQSVKVAGSAVLLESDTHQVVGCPFMIGNKYSPCVTITWSNGSTSMKAGGTAVLDMSSVGKCQSAEQATQGVAMKVPVQTQVTLQ